MAIVRLVQWPPPGRALLSFDQSPNELDALLSSECLLRPGNFWLFRVASDGVAYEVRGRTVRLGQHYILFTIGYAAKRGSMAVPTSVACLGVDATELNLGSTLDEETAEYLEHFGISQSRTIDVWPAGLAASKWDGERAAEWLSTDAPCIGIRADHDVKSFAFVLDKDASTWVEIEPSSPGQSVFVELPQLALGQHDLSIRAKAIGANSSDAAGRLQIIVREPMQWQPGSQATMLVVPYPTNPTMENMREGKATIEVYGPPSRRVRCSILLYERGNSEPLLQRTLPHFEMPAMGSQFRDSFLWLFRERAYQNGYDRAQSLEVRFDGEELGLFTLRCEREFAPLRWVVGRSSQGYGVRLLDDVDAADATKLVRYEFATPERPIELEPREFDKFHRPTEPGLYVAESGSHRRAVLIPPAVSRSFRDLRVQPQIRASEHSTSRVCGLLGTITMWGDSKLPGDFLSPIIRGQVVRAMLHEVVKLIGGIRWANLEKRFSEQSSEDHLLSDLKHAISREREAGLGALLSAKLAELVQLSAQQRVPYFADAARRFIRSEATRLPTNRGSTVSHTPIGVENHIWLSEFALRLASEPVSCVAWAGTHLEAGVRQLFDLPSLARSARFLVLVVARRVQSEVADKDLLFAGWRWQ